jgi:predicted Holliday junction resolvase-like endonuclease
MQTLSIIIIVALVMVILYLGFQTGKWFQKKQHEKMIPDIRQEAIQRSRAVLGGQFSEQLSPFLPDFPYSPTECRFIGKPIDFLVFQGMDEKNISEVKFVEVKSSKSQLNKQEKSLKDAIKNKKVSWEEYRVPEEVTREKKEE